MYKIKELSEDFIVTECSNPSVRDKGDYSYFVLKKKNYTTEKAISEIARKAGISPAKFSYAGLKDKRAVTEQFISVWYGEPALENIELKDIMLKFLGKGYLKISLGDLYGNQFKITVRNLSQKDIIRFANRFLAEEINEDFLLSEKAMPELISEVSEISSKSKLFIPNYFDEQRFSKVNCAVAKAIMKKDFEAGVKLMLSYGISEEALNSKWKDWQALLSMTNNSLERPILEHLIQNPNDFVGAMRTVPKKLLKMYIHSFQSSIFNRVLAERVMGLGNCFELSYSEGILAFPEKTLTSEKAASEGKILIPGFGTEIEAVEKGIADLEIMKKFLKDEGLNFRSFIISSIPELSSEGGDRDAFIEAKNLNISSFLKDELNTGTYKMDVSFFLQKGSYATIAIKNMFI